MDGVPLRVMCVDDNRDAADSEALLLACYGCVVQVCYDGVSALAEALRFAPDVCLVDYNMPGMDGCEVARRLKRWRGTPPPYLVAVTAHGSDEVRERTARAGFDLHLVKPVDWERLCAALAGVERALGRSGLVGAHARV